MNNCAIFNGSNSTHAVNLTPVNSAKMKTTTRFIEREISELVIADRTTIYLGKLIFLSISPRPTIDCMPTLVASVKKLQRDIPRSKIIGYSGVPSVIFKNRTNTVYITANSISGLRTDHKTPKNDPWYLNLKSVFTSSYSRTRFLFSNNPIFFILIYCIIIGCFMLRCNYEKAHHYHNSRL